MRVTKLEVTDESTEIIHSIECKEGSQLEPEEIIDFLARFVDEPYKITTHHDARNTNGGKK